MEYYLIHSGILGMKWGIRRYQYEDGSLTPEGRKRYGVKYEKAELKRAAKEKQKREAEEAKLRKIQNDNNARRDPREMTDAELQALVNRLRNEQAYLQMTGQQQNVGEAWYVKFGKDLAKKTLETAANKAGSAIGKKIVDRIFGNDTPSNSGNNNNNNNNRNQPKKK